MSEIMQEHRDRYAALDKAISAATAAIKLDIERIEASVGLHDMRQQLAELEEITGEMLDQCIFCEAPIFIGDDYACGEDGDRACRPCADRWRAENPEAAAEIDAAK